MAALREVFAVFGIEYEAKGAKEAESGLKGLKEGAEALVAVFAGNELVKSVTEFAEQVGHTGELAEQLGVGTDQLQLLQYAAEVSGSSTEELNASLSILQRSLTHAEAATGPQVEALKKLHIATKGAHGEQRNLSEILPEVFDQFGSLKSETDEAAVATALFGRSGVRMLPTLRQGAEGLKALNAEMAEYGGPLSEDTIKQNKQLADDMKRLNHAWLTFKGSLASGVLPQLAKAVEWIGKTTARLGSFLQGTTAANTAGLLLAGTIGVKLATALAPYLKSGLKFAAIFIAVDEVLGFLQGKDGLISRALNKAFGDGTADKVRAWVNDAIGQFGRMWSNYDEALAKMGDANASWVAQAAAFFIGFAHHPIDTFEIIGEGWMSILNDMLLDLDQFILDAENKWNGLVEKVVGSGNFVSELFHVDTGDAQARVDERKGLKDAYGQMAYERENARDLDKQFFAPPPEHGTRDAGPLGRKGVRDAFAAPARHGEGFSASDFFPPPGAHAPAPGGYAAAFAPPPTVPASGFGFGAPAVPPSITIDARTTVNVQGSADDATAKDVARRVTRTSADAHRKAAQALVPKKAAK